MWDFNFDAVACDALIAGFIELWSPKKKKKKWLENMANERESESISPENSQFKLTTVNRNESQWSM